MSFPEAQISNVEQSVVTEDHSCRFTAGDRKAFEAIYRENIQALVRYGSHLCQDKTVVEDSIQDVFVTIWTGRASLDHVQSIRSYLLICLRNAIYKRTAHEKRAVIRHASWVREELEVSEGKETEEARVARVRNAVNELTNAQREIVYLRFYEGLSYDDIAALLNIDRQHAYNMASKAYTFLKDHLRCV